MTFPKVFVARAAKGAGKLPELRAAYRKDLAAGKHVHWVSSVTHTCRNGTPECPYYEEGK